MAPAIAVVGGADDYVDGVNVPVVAAVVVVMFDRQRTLWLLLLSLLQLLLLPLIRNYHVVAMTLTKSWPKTRTTYYCPLSMSYVVSWIGCQLHNSQN